jgi:DNA-binding transcriptional MerR regulator
VHRSGAVARMLRMPVATLRVWERRYGLTQAALTPSGQRLYSAQDVRRLVLVKQLTDLGHAIGSLAGLDMPQLQRVAATHAQALSATQAEERPQAAHAPPLHPWRLAVIGAALGSRLQRPALLRRVGRPVVLLGPFDSIAQAAAALQGSQVDTLLFHEPQLHGGWLRAVDAAGQALAGVPKAVLFSFAADPVCESLGTAGTALLREPQPDAALAQWLDGLATQAAATPRNAAGPSATGPQTAPPRRWDDAALAAFANLPPTLACECPRHVAELLMQLQHFEAYSAACGHRNAADAQLHIYLHQVATACRTRFEAALEHVALHEGLLLPAPVKAGEPAGASPAGRSRAKSSRAKSSPARAGAAVSSAGRA